MRNLRIFSITAVSLVALMLAGCSREREDWRSAQAADTAEGYQQFLQQHPNSTYGVQAQARVKQLAEDRDWQVASAADTRDAYEQFVAQHADGKWAQEARIRIENFAQAATGAGGAPPAAGAVTAAGPAPAPKMTPKAAAPKTIAAAPTIRPVEAAKTQAGDHFVQLGAFRSEAKAAAEWKLLQAKFPAQLKQLKPRYVKGKKQAKLIYRLQVATASTERARDLCVKLKKRSQPCVLVAN